jgi:hypothetical protein
VKGPFIDRALVRSAKPANLRRDTDGPAGQASSSNASGCRPGLRLVPTSYLLRAYETEQSRLICLDALIYHLPIALTSSIHSSRPPADSPPSAISARRSPSPFCHLYTTPNYIAQHNHGHLSTSQYHTGLRRSSEPTCWRNKSFNSATKHRAEHPTANAGSGRRNHPDKSQLRRSSKSETFTHFITLSSRDDSPIE